VLGCRIKSITINDSKREPVIFIEYEGIIAFQPGLVAIMQTLQAWDGNYAIVNQYKVQ
jgi:hypothetical protein